ncbi:MAG: HAD family hydrolase [Spirochaetales bacterium]|nr:HAD family hydrolase [Spirochaetales bacterium]
MSYKAVCFDIDGTLYPIGTMNSRLLRLSLRHPLFGLRYRRNRREYRRWQSTFTQKVPFRWREAMIVQNGTGKEMPFDKETYRRTYERLESLVYGPMRRLYRRTRTFDGVRDTFLRIRDDGLKIGVFTDFPLFDKLEGMGLADLVDFAASSDDVGYLKPDTHCLEYLLYNLGMGPKDVLYVGDSYEKDVKGAMAAGIDAVLVNVKAPASADLHREYPLAKAVFRTWDEFDRWLAATMEDR